jgi:hypothetical protein
MADKVKPLKIEDPSTGGTQQDLGPTEMDPSQDYASVKGIAFEGAETAKVWADSGVQKFIDAENTTAISLTRVATNALSFNRPGNTTVGTYLYAGSMPSNLGGAAVFGLNRIIGIIATVTAVPGTTSVLQLQRRTAISTWADISGASITLTTASYKAVSSSLSVALSSNEEIACYVKSGVTLTNPVIHVYYVPNG